MMSILKPAGVVMCSMVSLLAAHASSPGQPLDCSARRTEGIC